VPQNGVFLFSRFSYCVSVRKTALVVDTKITRGRRLGRSVAISVSVRVHPWSKKPSPPRFGPEPIKSLNLPIKTPFLAKSRLRFQFPLHTLKMCKPSPTDFSLPLAPVGYRICVCPCPSVVQKNEPSSFRLGTCKIIEFPIKTPFFAKFGLRFRFPHLYP
jgi:hypothetical protein